MKVKEIIEKLQQVDPEKDANIFISGLNWDDDCYVTWHGGVDNIWLEEDNDGETYLYIGELLDSDRWNVDEL